MAFAAARREELGFGFFCLCKRQLSGDSDIGVELGIQLLDSSKNDFVELDGREFALAIETSHFLDGGEGELGVVHWGHENRLERKFSIEFGEGTGRTEQWSGND